MPATGRGMEVADDETVPLVVRVDIDEIGNALGNNVGK
jgi:hypothetical protein